MTRPTKRSRAVRSDQPWLAGVLCALGTMLLACNADEPQGPPANADAGAGGVGGQPAGAGGAGGVPSQGGAGGLGSTAGSAAAGASGAGAGGAPSTGGAGGMGGAGATGAQPASGAGGAGGSGASGAGAGGGAGAAAIRSAGCGTDPAPAGDASIEVEGTTRTYIVELPAGYDENTAYPLILGFHGAGLDAQGFRGYFDLGEAAGDEAIIAYLDALGNPTGWQYDRDIPFAEATLAQLKSQYCIDEARAFATGHSSGGYFTNALGCRLGDQLRAIAPVSGGIGVRSNCQGMPAVWIAHGDDDTIVFTTEGQGARDFWAEANGCDTSMSTPVEPSPCIAYAGCSPDAPVHYCEYPGNHSPPAFAVDALWSFFKSL